MINYFKAAEQVLLSVSIMEQASANLTRRKKYLISVGANKEPPTVDQGMDYCDTNNVNAALGNYLEYVETMRCIKFNSYKLEHIYGIVKQLDKEHQTLIRLWYFEHKPKDRVKEAMYIESLSTLYKLRNIAVAEFALLYYGAAALTSV